MRPVGVGHTSVATLGLPLQHDRGVAHADLDDVGAVERMDTPDHGDGLRSGRPVQRGSRR